jgi:hypothetical protein
VLGFSRVTSAPAATFPHGPGDQELLAAWRDDRPGPWLHCWPPPKQPPLPDGKLWRQNLPSTGR